MSWKLYTGLEIIHGAQKNVHFTTVGSLDFDAGSLKAEAGSLKC